MAYGLTSAGFTSPTLEDIYSQIASVLLDRIDPALNLSSSGVLGIVAGIVAEREMVLWQTLQDIYSAGDPAQAVDGLLDVLCAITGTVRKPPQKSLVRGARFTLAANSTVPAGSIVRVAGNPAARFVTRATITSTTAGTYTGDLEAEVSGRILANAGTLTDIVTAATGWGAITNPTDAVPGDDGETDTTLRVRRELELAYTGSGTVDAIRSHLLRYERAGVFPIRQASVFENHTDATDGNGLPPHSVECLLFDPDPVDADDVAQLIWNGGSAAGVATYGTTSGTATDSEGRSHTVRFSRSTNVECIFEVTVGVGDDWPTGGANAIKAAILEYPFTLGETVYRSSLYPAILGVDGVRNIQRIRAAKAGYALADADIAITSRQIAYTSAADITVIVV